MPVPNAICKTFRSNIHRIRESNATTAMAWHCVARLQRASKDDNASRLHDAVTSVANDIMKYNVMAGRKWYPCNVPVFLCTTVERVISFKNPISRESARAKNSWAKCQPDRIAFHRYLLFLTSMYGHLQAKRIESLYSNLSDSFSFFSFFFFVS